MKIKQIEKVGSNEGDVEMILLLWLLYCIT